MDNDHASGPLLTEAQFGERVALASRRGLPQWLWPDVPTDAWHDALAGIERVSREILTSGRAVGPLTGNPEAIGVASYTSGMGPLLGYWLSEEALEAPAPVGSILAQHYRENSLRMERLAARCVQLISGLRAGAIHATVLKGMQTAFTCFPTPGSRPMSDIDLFIDSSDQDAAQRVLRELGYALEAEYTMPKEQLWRHGDSERTPQSLAFVQRDDPWGIDLHTSTNRRYAEGAPIIRLDELVSRVAPERWRLDSHAHVMAAVPEVLFLACHAGCPFGNLRMLRLVELALYIGQAERSGAFSWDEFIEIGELTATLPHAHAALYYTDLLVPGIVPDDVLRRSRVGVPAPALKVIAEFTPATVHGIARCSVTERYMWTPSLSGKVRQLAHDFVPTELPRSMVLPAIKRRIWRVLSGTLSVEPVRF